jgi:hypothetical protein
VIGPDGAQAGAACSAQASALSQRSALGWTSTRTTWTGSFVQARQSIREEAFAPLAHDLTARIQASGDLIVVEALGGQQDHPGANYL